MSQHSSARIGRQLGAFRRVNAGPATEEARCSRQRFPVNPKAARIASPPRRGDQRGNDRFEGNRGVMGTCPATKPLVTASGSTAAAPGNGNVRAGGGIEAGPTDFIGTQARHRADRRGQPRGLKRIGQLRRRLDARWVERKSGGDNVRQLLGHVWVQFAQGSELILLLFTDDFLVRRPRKGHFVSQEVIKRSTQSEDVAAAIDEVRIQRLFVSHVIRCANTEVSRGDLGIVVQLGQTEIGEFRHAVRMKKDIVGLDIAMDVLSRMEESERIGDVDADLDRHADREVPVLGQRRVSGWAVDEL